MPKYLVYGAGRQGKDQGSLMDIRGHLLDIISPPSNPFSAINIPTHQGWVGIAQATSKGCEHKDR